MFVVWIMSSSKYFEIECFVLLNFDWRKCRNAFQKMICTLRPCVSFLEYVFVKVFRDRVFRAIKIRLNKMSKRFSQNDLYSETLCFFLDSAFVKVFRDRVFVLSKFDWRKCLNAFQKTICSKRPCVSFLD